MRSLSTRQFIMMIYSKQIMASIF